MSFNENGFLDNDTANMAAKISKQAKNGFEVIYDINRFAEKIKVRFKINNRNGQQVIVACLFIRILEGFQSAIILDCYGLAHDTKILIRAVLETLILLKNCCEDEEFVVQYIQTDEQDRLTWMNVAHKYSEDLFRLAREYATQERRSKLKEKIANEDIKNLGVEALAIKAGLQDWYNTIYRYTSQAVHSTPRSLEKYTVVGENDEICGFRHEPNHDDTKIHLFTLADLLLISLECTCSLFGVTEDFYKENFLERLHDLQEKLNYR